MNTINHIAVWVAGIVQFLLGAGWYTLLGRAWMAGIGKDEIQLAAEIGHSPLPYILALVAALVIAYTLAWLFPRLGVQSAAAGAKAGAVLALALIGSTLAQNYGFEARRSRCGSSMRATWSSAWRSSAPSSATGGGKPA